jgi:hypothetical protein
VPKQDGHGTPPVSGGEKWRLRATLAVEAWTDERLDDLAASLRPLPAEVARLSEEVARSSVQIAANSAQIANNTEELRRIRQDLLALHRMLAQIGWVLAFAVLAALVGVLATTL